MSVLINRKTFGNWRKEMKLKLLTTVKSIILLAISLAVMASPAQGKVLISENFDSGGGVTMPGETVFSGDDGAWTTGFTGSEEDGPGVYLSYDPATELNADSGTIEFELIRSNIRESEALFTFNAANGDALLSAYIFWNGFTQKSYPELKFEGVSPQKVWYTVLPNGRELESIPLGTAVGQDELVNLAFAWGPNESDCRIYVNGVPLEARVDIPFGMPAIIEEAATLSVGAEPMKIGDGAYDHLNSLITRFRVSDESLSQAELLAAPEVKSITHDAFRVAGYSGKLVTGDTLTVTVEAEPGGTASFTVGTVRDVPLLESNPGVYRGSYTVKVGDDVTDGLVTADFTNSGGLKAAPASASRTVNIDTGTYLDVRTSNDLAPADEDSRVGLTVTAADANGEELRDRQLLLTLSTTDEYTGTVGGGSFEDNIGGAIDVDWGGVTDSFGEVTAQYISGFAAKTILVSAKDMTSGDVGVGFIRSYIDGTVDVIVKKAAATALALAGSIEVSLSRDWLTADGRSRSRLTAEIRDAQGRPANGHNVSFTLYGDNGLIRVVQGKTDSRGRAIADYIAGTTMGQVQVAVRDMTSGLSAVVSIELRPDAPAEIVLGADPGEINVGQAADIAALVTDANGNPNDNVDVLYDMIFGVGELSAESAATSEDGEASVTFTGTEPGVTTIRGTVISRVPSAEEISAAEGAVFQYGLADDPGDLEVIEWLAEAGDEVAEGQDLVVLEDRDDNLYTVVAPRDGILSVLVAEEKDDVNYGDTLAYVIKIAE
jgi:biotin carboxyl carrier protein